MEDLQVGTEVKVYAVVNDDESVTATKIKIYGEEEPEVIDFGGTIASVASDYSSITVHTASREFASVVVYITEKTTICLYGSEIPLNPEDLTVGMDVLVVGVEASKGVTAHRIKVVEEEEEPTE